MPIASIHQEDFSVIIDFVNDFAIFFKVSVREY
jgi:hypothetical protein